MTNAFLKPIDFYKRDINPISQYIDQTSFYLSKMLNKPIESIRTSLKDKIKNKQIKLVDPIVNHFERNEHGDKYKKESGLFQYINNVVKQGDLLAPSFTVYMHPSKKESLPAQFNEINAKIRSIAKKEGQKAKAEGNILLAIFKNNEQINRKTYNNSTSGSFASNGSILHNPSAHSTLTSTTRTVSSLSNAINEKIISGNRHYFNVDIALNNIISIAHNSNKELIENVVNKYSLNYPSVQDVVDCIKYSTELYWIDRNNFKKIYDFICTLSETERASVVYTSDLYHIRKHNEEFVRVFLTELAKKERTKEYEDPIKTIRTHDESIVNFMHQICVGEVKGIGKDYSLISKDKANILAGTCDNIVNVINKYSDFFNALFLTKDMPASTANLPSMLRRSVVTSDTDSTLFSTDEFVSWYFKEIIFTDESFAIASSVAFLSTQCIAHNLAMLSANMGVIKEKLFVLAMKPEYSFPVFIPTSVAKHYFTIKTIQEGNVFNESEIEIKGVHLKNSALPKHIVSQLEDKMVRILNTIKNNNKISLTEELTLVADKERDIVTSIQNNEISYFKQSNINMLEVYKLSEDKSPYKYHRLWENVFKQKYGDIEKPQYKAIKIPTILNNKTQIKKWLDSLEDQSFSIRMVEWLSKYSKDKLNTIYINSSYLKAYGIPEEIKPIINIKKIVLEMTNADRMILETLGYFPKDGMLISESGY